MRGAPGSAWLGVLPRTMATTRSSTPASCSASTAAPIARTSAGGAATPASRAPAMVQNVSAVVTACAAVRRATYVEVGGMDEAFAVSHNV